MPLRVELAEFVNAMTAAGADGKYTADEIHEVIRQFVDCLGPLVSAVGGDAQAVEELATEAKEAAIQAIDALPSGRLGIKPIAKMGVEYAVPALVRSAVKAGVPVTAWIDANVLPRLEDWEQTIHRLRVALGG
jgi:hypothetical protein